MESPYFPIALKEMPRNILIEELTSFDFQIGAVRAQACVVNHPGIAVGYRLWTSGGSIAYLPDNEPFNSHQNDKTPQEVTLQNTKVREFIRDADVVMLDA